MTQTQQRTHDTVSRRRLFQGAAAAALTAGKPTLFGAERGFKTICVNHISYQTSDYTRVRDFYADLFGMKVSHDDGKQCYLAFGNSFIIPRNKLRPDVTPPLIDHIAYTIDDWDKNAVEAELRRRGLSPKADTENSFHVKDPDGFDLQIAGKGMRPEFWPEPSAAAGSVKHAAISKGPFTAITVNHISYQSKDFAKIRDFYSELLGMQVLLHTSHTGEKQTWLGFGDSYIIPRTSSRPEMKPPLIDHIAYTIDNWDKNAVEAELRRRGFDPRPDTDDSYMIKDPDGFTLQISGKNMKP